MVLAEILIKLIIFLPNRNESNVLLLVVQIIIFYVPNGLPTSFHFFKFMHGGMYFC